ncbi:hypothetical protein BKA93DRAFT_931278 [Sparassis latifolia]
MLAYVDQGHDFPDEILEKILSHILILPSRTFLTFRTDNDMTFAQCEYSSLSGLLLVSKSWLRVGTPMLYEAIIIRTSAQAAALEWALRCTPVLGDFICRLRLELALSNSVNFIVSSARRNLHTLYIFMDIPSFKISKTYVPGFRSSLRAINPSHLLLDHMPGEYYITQALARCVPQWTALRRIDINESSGRSGRLPRWLTRLLKNMPSSRHTFTDGREVVNSYQSGIGVGLVQPPTYADLLLHTVPGLTDKTWSRILAFATHVHHPDDYHFTEAVLLQSLRERVNDTRRSIMLVSRKFNCLGKPFLYSIPIFASLASMRLFIARIQEEPHLAQLVHVLPLHRSYSLHDRAMTSIAPFVALMHAEPLIRIFPELAGYFTDGEYSPLVSLSQKLYENMEDVLVPPRSFEPFPRLRFLSLYRGRTEFSPDDIPYDALPRLETLKMFDCRPSLIRLFTEMRLPALKEAEVDGDQDEVVYPFLQRHGAGLECLSTRVTGDLDKCETSILDLCPHIIELVVLDSVVPPHLKLLSTANPHSALARISLPNAAGPRVVGVDQPWDYEEEWTTFLDALGYPLRFPMLREVLVSSKFSWPQDEVSLSKHPLREPARNLSKHNVFLMDRTGKRWTRF